MTDRPTSASIVVPICDALAYLERSLPALAAVVRTQGHEWIVVDDGSHDGGPDLARSLGARVLSSGGRRLGPAQARNVGVAEASGEVIVFVDADVVVHEGSVEALVEALAEPGPAAPAAIYGSYDDRPPERGFASRYMNLRHHHYHQVPLEDSPTFWSGLGAVRRDAFLAVDGFDTRTFGRPSIEDIDLGHRLRLAGRRIRRAPAIRGTHLKRWGLREALRTDVLLRAWPWARLMARSPGEFGDLNVSRGEQARALLAGALVVTTAAAVAGLLAPWWSLGTLAAAYLVNLPLLRLFVRGGGLPFGLAALLWHQLYYLYSATTFTVARLVTRPGRGGAPQA